MDFTDGKIVSNGFKYNYVRIFGNGYPAVIIETAIGELTAEWYYVIEELSKFTTVIAYDRSGYGESPTGQIPRNASQISLELYNLINNIGIIPPFILIGSSEGGLYNQQFSRMYPELVAGLVLVNSLMVDNGEFNVLDTPVFKEHASAESRINAMRNFLEMGDDEFQEYAAPLIQDLYPDFPKEIQAQLFTYQSDLKLYKTIIDEFDSLEESCKNLKSQSGEILNIPVKILCRDFKVMKELAKQLGVPEDEARAVEDLWLNLSKRIMDLYSPAEFYIIKDSSHSVHLSKPDAIVNAVRDLLKENIGIIEFGE